MTPQQVVDKCEKILQEHDMAGIVVALDRETGHYGLILQKNSLFEWSEDETKVRLCLDDATDEQIEVEFNVLKVIEKMLAYCNGALTTLIRLLEDTVDPPMNTSKDKKKYVN